MAQLQGPPLGSDSAAEMTTHSSILAWKIPWMESLAGYSPRGRKESDTTSYRVPSPETPPFPRWSVSSD